MAISIPTGVFDIVPRDTKEPWRSSNLWQYVESVMRFHAELYGCKEIRTPIFEKIELFHRSVGEETDIVSKEMYTFLDRGDRMLALRPEGTASVMRAFIEKQLYTYSQIHRLFYICPMFRYERPQKGRFRQHHQFGVEIIGDPTADCDAELIEMVFNLYTRLGIKNLNVYINSLGSQEARSKYRTALINYLIPNSSRLSEDSKRRLDANPLRILDSKDPSDQEIVQQAPSILEFLSQEDSAHFERVQHVLKNLSIPYIVNANLVRGLDYYNKTVFEITSGQLGAQNTIGGGGRYDGLMKQLDGPDLPTIGFGTGLERIIQTLLQQEQIHLPQESGPFLYIIPLGERAKVEAQKIAQQLRLHEISVLVDARDKKLKQLMQEANSQLAQYVVVLGDNEVQCGQIQLKKMKTGETKEIMLHSLVSILHAYRYYRKMEAVQKEQVSPLTHEFKVFFDS